MGPTLYDVVGALRDAWLPLLLLAARYAAAMDRHQLHHHLISFASLAPLQRSVSRQLKIENRAGLLVCYC